MSRSYQRVFVEDVPRSQSSLRGGLKTRKRGRIERRNRKGRASEVNYLCRKAGLGGGYKLALKGQEKSGWAI